MIYPNQTESETWLFSSKDSSNSAQDYICQVLKYFKTRGRQRFEVGSSLKRS